MTTKAHHCFLNEHGLINRIDVVYHPLSRNIRLELSEIKTDSIRISLLIFYFYVTNNNSLGYTPSLFSNQELQAFQTVLPQVVPFPLNMSTLFPIKAPIS